MKLDLRKDRAKLLKHVNERVKDYPVYINMGPGKDEDPIKLVTFGYEFDQGGWVCLVFDTRSNADTDGQWTVHLEELIEFSHWHEAISALQDGTTLSITLPNGKTKTIKEHDDDVVSSIFGMMLASILKESKSLAKLPMAHGCRLNVEDFTGTFAHTLGEAKSRYDSSLHEKIETEIKKMKAEDQLVQLIDHLERMAKGKSYKPWDDNRIYDQLKKLGEAPVLPLLKFARKWAGKPEFSGDRPQKDIRDQPHSYVVLEAIWFVKEAGCATKEIKKLLQAILRKSLKANEGRRLWGTLPREAAACIGKLFEGYPFADGHDSGNHLMNPEPFLS